MSRLADYFVIVGYDHEKERKFGNMFIQLAIEVLYLKTKT